MSEENTEENRYIESLTSIEDNLYQAISMLEVLQLADLDNENNRSVRVDKAVIWKFAEGVTEILQAGQVKLDDLRSDIGRHDDLVERVGKIMREDAA